jgi:hypothetical protein
MHIVEAYLKLAQLMEDIDYYNKYPSRSYLKEFIDRENTVEGKVRAMLQDSLIQREVFPNWISKSNTVSDVVEHYFKINEAKSL